MSRFMKVAAVRSAKKTYPTGNPNFWVMQAFPAGFTAEEADPFLMCDFFSAVSKGELKDPDEFEVPWHPHRGMDICTYLRSGVGRHADSMGNRGTYPTPGIQWISVGSGIEHAEGGGTPKGQLMEGFQIWINVPSSKKLDPPRYGVPEEGMPSLDLGPGVVARLLAGTVGNTTGPFQTVAALQMLDLNLSPGASVEHAIPQGLNSCILYVYGGGGKINESDLAKNQVVRLDSSDDAVRSFRCEAGNEGLNVMVFAGRRLNQPIAWHGPFVMTTQAELQQTFKEYSNGQFPPVRTEWDYRKWSEFPDSYKKRDEL